jgi:Leucine-rich repeat (LRR) protein
MSERVEDADGYFTIWTGRHDPARVRDLNLYLLWRDGSGRLPPMSKLIHLERLTVPLALLDPAPLRHLPRLRSLCVVAGEGEPLPDGLAELSQLTDLDVSCNTLSSLPGALARMRLERLKVGSNELSELPELPPSLVELDAGQNRFAVAPRLPRGLRKLDLGSNPLATLDVAALPPAIEELVLSGCPLTSLPSELPELERLRSLRLASCKLQQLPQLTSMHALAELWLQGNTLDPQADWLTCLPDGLAALWVTVASLPPTVSRLHRLRELQLSGDAIRELPSELAALRALEKLVLMGHPLGDSPSLVHLPSSLRSLNLTRTGLSELPARLAALTELRELGLGMNRLVELPPWLSSLSLLENLWVNHNQLTAFPEAVLSLRALARLNLESNRIEHIPDQIGALGRLRTLEMRCNRLRALPSSIAQLAELEELDLVANQLSSCPEVLRALPRLAQVQLGGNPMPYSEEDAWRRPSG